MDAQRVVGLINLTALAAIMLAMGLQVTVGEVAASARFPGRVVLSLAANYGLVPAATLGLLHLFQPNPQVAVGFLILAVCPGAPVGPVGSPGTELEFAL